MESNDCIPKHMKSIKDLSQNISGPEICNDVSGSGVSSDPIWNQLMELAGNCQKPCTIIEYQGTIKKYLGWGNFNEGSTMQTYSAIVNIAKIAIFNRFLLLLLQLQYF